ncbi:MAG TPA: NAD(P)-binding protein, partial [Anaerolineales bacterium]
MRKRFVVIGSGFGGLAVAVRLAARGYDVELFEKCDRLGGRAGQFEINGFKFDAGPTAITVPFLFDEIWKTAGKNREDYFQLVPVDPFFRAFDFQGRYIDFSDDQENLLSQIEQRSPGDRQGLEEYWRRSQRIFDKGFNQLSGRPFLKRIDMLMAAPDLLRLESYRSIYSYVSRLVKDDLLRRALTFHTLLAGGNPFDT